MMQDPARWKAKDRDYHGQYKVVSTYDQRISRRYAVEHDYYSVTPWMGQLAPHSRVLDLGCGTGETTLRLLRQGFHVVSLDASSVMLDCLRAKARQAGLPCVCQVGDAENLDFAADRFDAVVCTGVLHHVPDSRQAVAEIIRVLKPGGRFLLAEPFRRKPWVSWGYHAAVWLLKQPRHWFHPQLAKHGEKPLSKEQLQAITDFFVMHQIAYQLNFLIYWPVACGWLPKKAALALIRGLNHVASQGGRADSIIIQGRKP